MDAGRHGSRSSSGLFNWLLAAAGTPSPVFRRRDSAPFARPYRPGTSRESPALRPAPTGSPGMIPCRRCCMGGGAPDPVCCLAVFSPPSPLRDRRGTEHSL
ncbi:hypothetical protein NDU88_006873 [Pleurodeles waltl]|uniref:Secreted protein n=1 Tax=Pleurodeles waltl TaxID=8319 RepID=A0AAV7MH16_PLEWA|nr:hypothetical protein NDU88_006873 [Pleurodeles waltl]